MTPPVHRRSILHGTCLVHGHHRAGTSEARECPLLRARISSEENARRVGRRTGARRPEDAGPAITLQAPQARVPGSTEDSSSSNTIFRRGRAFKPGRPPVGAVEQRLKARVRDRAYRRRIGSNVSQEG